MFNQQYTFGLILYAAVAAFSLVDGQYGPSQVVSADVPSRSSSDYSSSSRSTDGTGGSNSYGQIAVQLQPSTMSPMTMMSGSLMATTSTPPTMPSTLTVSYDGSPSSSGGRSYGSQYNSRLTDGTSNTNNYMTMNSANQQTGMHSYGQNQRNMYSTQPSSLSNYGSSPSWSSMPFGQVSAYAPATTTQQSTSLPVVIVPASPATSYGSSPATLSSSYSSPVTSSYPSPTSSSASYSSSVAAPISSYSYEPTTTTTSSLPYSQYGSANSYVASSSYSSPTYSYGSYGSPTSARLVNYVRDTTYGAGPYVWDNLKNPLTAQEIQSIMATAIPGIDFPTLSVVPNTSFTCAGRAPGFYADPQARCQAFHRCTPQGNKYSFLCPNMTLFNQLVLVCDWYFNVDCTRAEQFYSFANPRIYQQDMPLHDTPPPSYVAANIQDYFNRQLKYTGGVYGAGSTTAANMRHARQLLSSSYYPASSDSVSSPYYYGQSTTAAVQEPMPQQYQMLPSAAASTSYQPVSQYQQASFGLPAGQPQQRFFDSSNSGIQQQQQPTQNAFGTSAFPTNNAVQTSGFFGANNANNLGGSMPSTTTTLAPGFQTNAQLPQYYWQL